MIVDGKCDLCDTQVVFKTDGEVTMVLTKHAEPGVCELLTKGRIAMLIGTFEQHRRWNREELCSLQYSHLRSDVRLRAVQDELDVARAKLAEAERDRDQWRATAKAIEGGR